MRLRHVPIWVNSPTLNLQDASDALESVLTGATQDSTGSSTPCHFTWSGLGVEELAADLGLPMVLSVYGADVTLAAPHENDRLFRAADIVRAPSKYLESAVLASGIDSAKVALLYNHVDGAFFTPGSDGIDQPLNAVPAVLTVARLQWKKALLDGLLALAESRRRGFEFRYRLAGEGTIAPRSRPPSPTSGCRIGSSSSVRWSGGPFAMR